MNCSGRRGWLTGLTRSRRAVRWRAPAVRAVRRPGPPAGAAARRRADRRARRRQRRGHPRAYRRARPHQWHERHPGDPRSGDRRVADAHGADQGRADRQRPAGGQETLVINGGWLQLPPDLLTQAGIGRRAHVQLSPDGLVVTPVASDSVPAPLLAGNAVPQPREQWAPVQVELRSVLRSFGRGPTQRHVLRGLAHEFAPGQANRHHRPLGVRVRRRAAARGRARPPEFGPDHARRASAG